MVNDGEAAIVKRIRERRGGGLGQVDLALLHAPATADGWYVLSNKLSPRLHSLPASPLPLVVLSRLSLSMKSENLQPDPAIGMF